jgi:hypothetical protein
MNLDELAQKIREVSDEKVVQGLADLLVAWKEDQRTAEQLRESVERYIGNSWIEKDADHSKVYQMWSLFRDQAILGIDGMTMNERLHWFGLVGRYDACRNQEAKVSIYRKLHANP